MILLGGNDTENELKTDSETASESYQDSGSEYQPSDETEDSEEENEDGEFEEENNEDQLEENEQTEESVWREVSGETLQKFVCNKEELNVPLNLSPLQIYREIITDDILDLIVNETNKNAKNYNNKWKYMTKGELEHFFAIIIYMGLVKFPKIADYWSTKFYYKHCFVRHIMSRNRFQSILRFLHFTDNLTADKSDRLYKIQPLVNLLNNRFKELKKPGEVLSIDESMVPFRGRLIIKQYIPNKSSKYGVKIFKICDEKGYTYDSIMYKGKSETRSKERVSNKVVLQLMGDYLNQGRTLVQDNFYNNIELTKTLLSKKTHVVGTLRKRVKYIPKEILTEKGMKKGDIKGKEKEGIVVANWKDKRAVRFITTRHTINTVDSGKKNRKSETVFKPEAIVFYNKYKMVIDISDQISSYHSVLRRTLRWYHKVAFEYLFGTAVVNARHLYNASNNTRIKIGDFRQKLLTGLLGEFIQEAKSAPKKKHMLQESVEKTRDNRIKRKRCLGCYENEKAMQGNSKIAALLLKMLPIKTLI
ncbi:hypothetical protein NQ314_017039 [Rhamnusium bicolor]|uniref:PiggyBac transposable element-derived protein domain-containing protein n=1 Tax=Rhamnusium bicolor TaxID=1586634 RepID=A0AAV8WUC4_9CUCU|nr:hypothetical protein NQ314_017039 [Rhamnusium bicolor]